MNINKNIKVSEWILFGIVIFMLFATMATDVNSIISCGSDATCNTLACVLGDDTGYRFTALDFAGTTGFDDLTDDTGSFTNGISINVTDLNVSGNIHFYGLTNCDTIDSDANGLLSCGTDASGGAADINGTDVWFNLLFANDWTNVSLSYSQIYDFNPDDYYLKIGIPNCNSQQKVTADGETFTCAADLYNTTENMQDSVLPAIYGGVGITATYNDGSNNETISFDCSEVMDTADDFNCGDGQEVTLKNRANYILVSNGSWVRSQFGSSSNISFDSSTGQFWINTSISGSQLTYAQLGGFSSANQTTYANLGGWSSLNNTVDNVIRSTNSTWITYTTLGGFNKANETTYANHGGFSSANLTANNVILNTNLSWIQTWYGSNGWSALNNSLLNVILSSNTSWISTNEKTYAAHGGFTLANQSYSSMGGFTKANETTYVNHGGFAKTNLSLITAQAAPLNITINNLTSSNGASFELFYNSTCSRLIIGSTIQYWCK